MSGTSPSVRAARGTSYLLIRSVVGELVALIYFVFAARIFSVAEIGAISALNMVVATFVILGMFAIPSAATKFVSEYVGRNRLDMAKGVYTRVLIFGFLSSVSISVLCFVSSTVVSSIVFGGQGYQLLINVLALDIFASLFSSFFIGVLYGLQKFREVALFGIVNNFATYGSALYLLFRGHGLIGLMWAWVIGDFVGLGLVSFVASTSFRTKVSPHSFMKLFRYSSPLYLSSLLNFLSTYVDRFIILFLAGLTTLGVYGIVIMAVGVVLLVSNAMGHTLFPQFSELYGGYGRESLKQASMSASRYVFLIYVPLAVGLAATAYPVITLFMGLQYGSGWLPLAILSLATALACGGIVVNSLLLSLGATRAFLEANILAIVVDTVLCVFLVSPLGGVGAALARGALILTLFVYPTYRLKKMFGLFFDSDALKKSWVGSVVMSVVVVLMQLVWMDGFLLPLYVLVGGVVYVLMLRSLNAVDDRDIQLLYRFVPKRFGAIVDVLGKLLGVEKLRGKASSHACAQTP